MVLDCQERVTTMGLCASGLRVIVPTLARTIAIWDADRMQIVKTATGHEYVEAMSLSPDGNWLASIGEQENLLLWDL